jgi:hypothetical protein
MTTRRTWVDNLTTVPVNDIGGVCVDVAARRSDMFSVMSLDVPSAERKPKWGVRQQNE